MIRMLRLCWLVTTTTTVALCVVLWNPLNFDFGWSGWLYASVLSALTAISLVISLAASCRARVARYMVAMVGGMLVVVGIGFWAVVAMLVYPWKPNHEELLAESGSQQLVLVELSGIDVAYRVELRRNVGPIRQGVVVWDSGDDGPRPNSAWFTGMHDIVVNVDVGPRQTCEYHATFDRTTLDLDHAEQKC